MGDELLAVTLARIEGKLDLLHAAITAAEARGTDHEARIRTLEHRPQIDPQRVVDLEDRPVGITPGQLLASLASFGTLAAALSAIITLLTR